MHGILPFLLAMIAAIVLLEMLATKDKLVGFFMNSLLTRRIRTSKNETAYILLKSSVSSTSNSSDIDKICANSIDQFDAQYFEKERRKPD